MRPLDLIWKCRECGWTDIGPAEPDKCEDCDEEGTFVAEEPEQPTADGGTANARRSSRSDEVRSTFAEEARALTGGAAKLREYFERRLDEAHAAYEHYQLCHVPGESTENISETIRELDELLAIVVRWETEAPAVSVKPS
jgi:hypothetical protein